MMKNSRSFALLFGEQALPYSSLDSVLLFAENVDP